MTPWGEDRGIEGLKLDKKKLTFVNKKEIEEIASSLLTLHFAYIN